MNGLEFKELSIEKQVEYVNEKKREGESLSSVCKDLGISKSVGGKFKKHGYTIDEETNLYILKPIDGQLSIEEVPQENKKVSEPTREPQSNENKQKALIDQEKEKQTTEPIKRGRPQRETKGRKHTVFINDDTWKALQLQSIKDDVSIALIVEKALNDVIRADTWELYNHMEK